MILTDKGNAFATSFHPSVHLLVPNFDIGTSGGIRTLCINHNLVIKTVLIEFACGSKIVLPVTDIFQDIFFGIGK
nr:hypothetical protein [Anaerotignum sp.]